MQSHFLTAGWGPRALSRTGGVQRIRNHTRRRERGSAAHTWGWDCVPMARLPARDLAVTTRLRPVTRPAHDPRDPQVRPAGPGGPATSAPRRRAPAPLAWRAGRAGSAVGPPAVGWRSPGPRLSAPTAAQRQAGRGRPHDAGRCVWGCGW